MCSIWSKLDGCEFDESHRQLMRHYVVHTHTLLRITHPRRMRAQDQARWEKYIIFRNTTMSWNEDAHQDIIFCRLSSRSSFNRCSRFTASNSVHPCVCFFILFILALLLFLFARNCINYCHTYRKSRNSTLHLEQKMHHMFHVCFKCGVCVFSFRFFLFEPNECSFFFVIMRISLSLSRPLSLSVYKLIQFLMILSSTDSLMSIQCCCFYLFFSVYFFRSFLFLVIVPYSELPQLEYKLHVQAKNNWVFSSYKKK